MRVGGTVRASHAVKPGKREGKTAFASHAFEAAPLLPRDDVKDFRVLQIDAKTYTPWKKTYQHCGPSISITQADGVKRVPGTTPVEPDASVCFRAPPGRALHLQLLDKDYRCVQTMRSLTGVMGKGTTMSASPICSRRRMALPCTRWFLRGGATPCCAAVVAAIVLTGRTASGGEGRPRTKPGMRDAGERVPTHHEAVLALGPIGYWPADEGQGKVLHDRSGNGNHGTIYSVPWKDGLLVFENDVYQWIQVPCRESYRSRSFSMGGWVFSALHKRKRASEAQEREFQFGALIIGQPFRLQDGGKLKWAAIWGTSLQHTGGAMLRFGLPGKGGLSLLEVVSGQEADVLGTVQAGIGLQSGHWQHVMYTYAQSGEAKLYIDGELAHSAGDVPYTPSETPFVFGGGRWGTFNLGGTLSMAGSLRDMVIFDRTLSQAEIRTLTAMMKPSRVPGEITVASGEKSDLPDGPDQLIKIVEDESLDRDRRAQAVLELAKMGGKASGAVPALAGELERIDREQGAHLPRVEEFFRNALIKALLDIDPDSARTDALLAEALAKPYLATLDLSRSYLKDVVPLIRSGKETQALRKVREHFAQLPTLPKLVGWGSSERAQQLDEIRGVLPLRQEYFDRYISKGVPFADAQYNAYNQIDTYDGSTYLTVVERVPYQEVLDLYERQLKSFADRTPDPEGKWSRVELVRIGPDGAMEQRVLMGDWFVYDARDAKMDGWAVALDRDGYIHLLGGQHNRPNQANYVPGSWEKMGVSEEEVRPQVMYWVSTAPGEIGSFEFMGQSNNPRSVVGWMNYMNFARDPKGRLFVYGRGRIWSWALVRYDADEKRWIEIRGSAADMLRRAEEENPEWSAALGDTTPYFGPGDGLVCAWQPGAYNFNRGWGGRALSFDRTGRMHVRMAILGVGEDGRMTSGPVYAYSDDLGQSFHAADGKPLKLPLTVNPIPSHNGNTSGGPLKRRCDLWASLVKELP